MVTLIANGTELELSQAPISIELLNALFIDGLLSEYSLPFELPATPTNLQVFNWPNLHDGALPPETLDATLTHGALSLTGKLHYEGFETRIRVRFSTGSEMLKEQLTSTMLNSLNFGSVQVANTEELVVVKFVESANFALIPNDYALNIIYRQPGSGTDEIYQSFFKKPTLAATLDDLVSRLNGRRNPPPTYDASTTYMGGDVVVFNGIEYFSWQDNNVGNDPTSTGLVWWDPVYGPGIIYPYFAAHYAEYDVTAKVANRIYAERFGNYVVIWNTTNLEWVTRDFTLSGTKRVVLLEANLTYEPYISWPLPPLFGPNYEFFKMIQTEIEGTESSISTKAQVYLYRGIRDAIMNEANSGCSLPMVRYPSLAAAPAYDRDVANYQRGGTIDLFEGFNAWAPHVSFLRAAQVLANLIGYELVADNEDTLDEYIFACPRPVVPATSTLNYELKNSLPEVSLLDWLLFLKDGLGLVAHFDTNFKRFYLIDVTEGLNDLPALLPDEKHVPRYKRNTVRRNGIKFVWSPDDTDEASKLAKTDVVTPAPQAFTSWTDGLNTLGNLVTYDAIGAPVSFGFGPGQIANGERVVTLPALPVISEYWTRQQHATSGNSQRSITGNIIGGVADSDGNLYLFGDFTVAGTTLKNLVKLLPNGEIDTYFWSGLDFNGPITHAKFGPDGWLYVAGSFTRAVHPNGGTTLVRMGLVRVNRIGLPDVDFRMFGFQLWPGQVKAMDINKEWLVIVNGSNRLQAWQFDDLMAEPLALSLEGAANMIHLHHNGRDIYVSGAGTIYASYATIKLDFDLVLDTEWLASYGGIGTVNAMASTEDRTYFAGLGGATSLVVTEDNGTTPVSFPNTHKPTPSNGIKGIAISNNAVYLVGNFASLVNGNTCRGFCGLRLDGTRPDELNLLGGGVFLNPTGTTAGDVRFITEVGKRLVIGGSFARVDSLAISNVALLNKVNPMPTTLLRAFKHNSDAYQIPVIQNSGANPKVIRFGLRTTRTGAQGGTVNTLASRDAANWGQSLNWSGAQGVIAWRFERLGQVLDIQDRLEVEMALNAVELAGLKVWQVVQLRGAVYLVHSISYQLPLRSTVKLTLVRVYL